MSNMSAGERLMLGFCFVMALVYFVNDVWPALVRYWTPVA